MEVEILRGVMIKGEPAPAGSVLDLEDAEAVMLIGMNKAKKSEVVGVAPQAVVEPNADAPKRGRKPAVHTEPEEG